MVQADELAIGCDYGFKPAMGIMGDAEFPDLLRRGLVALGYARLPQFGPLADPPLLGMIFNAEDIARECFAIFSEWAERSEDGDAVGLGFIEFENGEYGFCVYQDQEMLIDRCVPEELRAEVEPFLFSIGHLKMFPQQSASYRWFKGAVKAQPFVLAPSTQDAVSLDLAISKCQVNFFYEKEVPEHTMEAALLRLHDNAPDHASSFHPDLANTSPDPSEIAQRRSRQLARFFPVTLERLRHHTPFQEAKEQLLIEGYREWQIIQAACNITFQGRAPQLFERRDGLMTGEREMPKVQMLYYLVSHYENITVSMTSSEELNTQKLRVQILADVRDLLLAVVGEPAKDVTNDKLQGELEARGLLGS